MPPGSVRHRWMAMGLGVVLVCMATRLEENRVIFYNRTNQGGRVI